MAEFHYLESFSAPSLCSPPCLQYFEWIRTNVFLVTSRSEYLDPWKRSRVPVINALYKVPWKNAVAGWWLHRVISCAPAHAQRYADTWLHLLEVVVDRGAPVSALHVDHGRHSYSNRVTKRPSLNSPKQCHTVLPSPRSFMLFSVCYIFTYTGFVGHNQVITSLRAAYRMMDFHWSTSFLLDFL